MLIIRDFFLPINYKEKGLEEFIAKKLNIKKELIESAFLKKLSLDARKKNDIHYTASAIFSFRGDENVLLKKHQFLSIFEEKKVVFKKEEIKEKKNIVVVGFGPAGMFCSLVLSRMGFCPIVLERGESVENREKSIQKLFNEGKLNENSNIQFGEGGAGTFSDGKLNSGIKSEYKDFVLDEFYKMGADESVLYNSKAHIGTDKLVTIVKNIRQEILKNGGKVLFNTKLTDIILNDNKIEYVVTENGEKIEADDVVFAIGHSAFDTFKMLNEKGFYMEQKPFSIGVRVEHTQEEINVSQYGKDYDKRLPNADYKLFSHLKNGRTVYTFCMCPGGEVVMSSSENGTIVTNGMSYFKRDGVNANSAVLVDVTPNDFESTDVLSGFELQRKYEKLAYNEGFKAPCQLVKDFMLDKESTKFLSIKPTIKTGTIFRKMSTCLPDYVVESLKQGLKDFSKKLNAFSNGDAILIGVETRSSSPVRVNRKEDLTSINISNAYPCGEGCGYAGGIMSSAIDGIKCAKKIRDKYFGG